MAVTLVNTSNVVDDATLRIARAWDVTGAVVGGLPYLYVSGFQDSGISAFAISITGQLTSVLGGGGNLQDDMALALGATSGLHTLAVGGNTLLYATGSSEGGLNAIRLDAASGGMAPLAGAGGVFQRVR